MIPSCLSSHSLSPVDAGSGTGIHSPSLHSPNISAHSGILIPTPVFNSFSQDTISRVSSHWQRNLPMFSFFSPVTEFVQLLTGSLLPDPNDDDALRTGGDCKAAAKMCLNGSTNE
jgi:hypothetical protein